MSKSVNGGTVTIPAKATGTLTMTDDGRTIGLGIPDTQGASTAHYIGNATVFYAGRVSDATIAARANSNGMSEYIMIAGANAPKQYTFKLKLPAGATLEAQPGGGYTIVENLGNGVSEPIGELDAPWAKDADGNSVSTSYKVRGNTVIQTVTFNSKTAFPVVADPYVETSMWNFGLVWSRSATKRLDDAVIVSGGAVSVAVLGCGALPVPFSLLCGAAVIAYGTWTMEDIHKAAEENQCFEFRESYADFLVEDTPYPAIDKGDWCHDK